MSALAKRLNLPPEIDYSLKECPFCGAPAEVQFWHGGRPSKRLISCSDPLNECDVRPMVSGPTLREAREKWDRRAP